jgi:predicted metalloprotease with PDZ domain
VSPRLAFLLLLAQTATATAQESIDYVLRFPEAKAHYVDVEASYPTGGRDPIELMMAVWTPGSYLVREYSRHVEDVEGVSLDGSPLAVTKIRKNRWQVRTGGDQRVRLRYRVYSREMTVRTNWVEAEFAILNGAPTFLTLVDGLTLAHDVTLELPDAWAETWTGMPRHPDGGRHHYLAPDFDTLVDSPVYAGNPAVYEFEVAGKKHYLVNHGEGGIWDGPRSAEDVQSIVEAAYRFWGELPYERYVFLNLITEGRGGLEHKNSNLIMTSRWRARVPKDYRGWLAGESHEFFHAWNVKRLRPLALGPFDYEHEVYTRSLWVAEGVTSYYDDLLLERASLMTEKQYLKALSRQIESLQTTPGRKVRPLELSSFDSWIRQYRPDENSRNATISYYTKGAVVAFLLDAKIRRATRGEKSLDDVMRMAYELYSNDRGYTPEEFRAVASEIAGDDLSSWFETALDTTDELSYEEALDWYGLRFKQPDGSSESEPESEPSESEHTAWLGFDTRNDNGRLVVTRVLRDTPAYDDGFNVDDEILGIDDYRVEASEWKTRLEQYQPGDEAEVLVSRRERLLRLPVVFGEKPKKRWRLEVDPESSYDQRKRREHWLNGTPRATSP